IVRRIAVWKSDRGGSIRPPAVGAAQASRHGFGAVTDMGGLSSRRPTRPFRFAPNCRTDASACAIAMRGRLWFLSDRDPLHKFQTVKSAPRCSSRWAFTSPGLAGRAIGERRRMAFFSRITGPAFLAAASLMALAGAAGAQDGQMVGAPHPWQLGFQA